MPLSRRAFVSLTSGFSAFGLASLPRLASSQAPTATPFPAADAFPAQDPAAVKELVGASHGNFARVKEIVEKQPAYARASVDWGFGDWETCIDAAAHVGNRPIAELLLIHGARPTIFSAAMMGQLDVVKAFIVAHPGIQKTYGPHGITLMSHARAGGKDAEAVVEYLKQVGDADIPLPTQPLAPADRDVLPGKYVYGPGLRDHFIVDVQRDQLGIDRPSAPTRRFLMHTGNLTFFPSGVPTVRIAFAREGATVTRLTIANAGEVLSAKRT
jgi:hypothetical protein